MSERIVMPTRDVVMDALYKALEKWDYEVRSARNLRIALGGRGPRIVRGTKRSAMTRYLTDAVMKAIAEDLREQVRVDDDPDLRPVGDRDV